MKYVLVHFCAVLSAMTAGLTSMAVADEMTAARIQQLADVASAVPPNVEELTCYPIFTAERRSQTIGKSAKNGVDRNIQFSCLTAEEIFVIQIRTPTGSNATRLIDVIGYDESADVYRRWRLAADGTITAMIGLRESNDWALAFSPRATGSSIISWSGVTGAMPKGVDVMTAVERLDNGATKETRGISWKCRSLSGDSVIQSEAFNIREADDVVPVSLNAAPTEFPKQKARASTSRNATKLLDALISGARSRRSNKDAAESESALVPKPSTVYQWRDRNLALRLPADSNTTAVPPEQIHPNAMLAIYRPIPFQTDTIISHSDGAPPAEQVAVEKWIRRSVSDIRKNIPKVRLANFEDHKLGNRPVCRTFSYSAQEPELTRCHTFLTHAQGTYEIVTSVVTDDVNVARSAADEFLSRLSLTPQDSTPQSSPKTSIVAYPKFGVQFPFVGMTPESDETSALCDLYPAAQMTHRFSEGDFIAMVPVDISAFDLNEDMLLEGLTACTHFQRPISVRVSERIKNGSAKGARMVTILPTEERLPLTQEVRMFRNGSVAVAVIAGMFQRGSETEKHLKQRLDAVKLVAPTDEVVDDAGRLPVNHVALNRIGQTLVRDGHYRKAVSLFSAALDADPTNDNYRKNADRARRLAELSL